LVTVEAKDRRHRHAMTLMREFADIKRQLQLIKFTDSANGTLYCVPVSPGAPRLIVRHFDQALPPSLVTAYARLIIDAAAGRC
jgi:hypothetical protein